MVAITGWALYGAASHFQVPVTTFSASFDEFLQSVPHLTSPNATHHNTADTRRKQSRKVTHRTLSTYLGTLIEPRPFRSQREKERRAGLLLEGDRCSLVRSQERKSTILRHQVHFSRPKELRAKPNFEEIAGNKSKSLPPPTSFSASFHHQAPGIHCYQI